jgi:hypothetical protein
MQIYRWTSMPSAAIKANVADGIVVLVVTLLLLNSVAIVLRNRFQKRLRLSMVGASQRRPEHFRALRRGQADLDDLVEDFLRERTDDLLSLSDLG